MLKKIILILVVAMMLSCDQGNTGNSGSSAFAWLLKAGLIFGEKQVFTITYSGGYNINFEITEEQARHILPDNLTPMPLKLLESDTQSRYYLSWYLAGMDETSSNVVHKVKRTDLFTYAIDENGDRALYFLSSIMEMPEKYANNAVNRKMYIGGVEYMAKNSKTGKVSYPSYFTETFKATGESFLVEYESSSIELAPGNAKTTGERFSRDFILANSQIYRNEIDKNVNFFNQGFIDVNVETRNISNVSLSGLEVFLERYETILDVENILTKDKLRSVHYYGSDNKPITWFFEM